MTVLATVAQKGPGLIQRVKSYPGVELLHLTRENRDEVTQQVTDRLISTTE
jgi:nucleoside-triphosphatase THEP1